MSVLTELFENAPRALNLGVKPITPDDDSPIATIFGVPVGLQLGTAMGIENPFGRLAVDILTDPLTWLSGGVAGLTKLGKAVKFSKGMSAASRAKGIGSALRLAAKAAQRPDLAKKALMLSAAGKADEVIKIGKEFRALKPTGELKGLFSRKTQRELVNLFEQTAKAEGKLPGSLVGGWAAQAAEGQRALIQFSVPFSNIQKTLVTGVPVFEQLEKVAPKIKGAFKSGLQALPGAKASAETLAFAKGRVGGTAPEILRHQADEIVETMRGATAPDYDSNLFRDLSDVRQGHIAVGNLQADVFANELRQAFPDKALREKIPFLLEKRVDPTQPLEGLSRTQTQYVDELLDMYKRVGTNLQEQGVLGDLLEQGYVGPQLWDLTEKGSELKLNKLRRALRKSTGFAQERTIPTLAAGIKAGLKPKTTDIADLASIYLKNVMVPVANRRFLGSLRFARDQISGNPVVSFAKDLGKGEARKLAADGWKQIGGEARNVPRIWAHPDIADEIQTLMTPVGAKGGDIAEAAYKVNMFVKASALSMSLFHYQALSESAFATLGAKFVKGPRELTRAGVNMMRQGADIIQHGVKNGLQLGGIDDAGRAVLENSIDKLAKSKLVQNSLLRGPVTGLKKVNDVYQKNLWDVYHNGIKAASFAELYKDAIMKAPKGFNPDKIAREVSAIVNEAYGGLNWERMANTKQWRRGMQVALFAPDWTTSNLRIARDIVVAGGGKMMPGLTNRVLEAGVRGTQSKNRFMREVSRTLFGDIRDLNDMTVRSKYARQYALRAGVAFASTTALANLLFSGHFPWQNEKGHKVDIQLPGRDANGKARYLRIGKQFREPFEWVANPRKRFASKLGFLPRIGVAVATGRDPIGRPVFSMEGGPIEALSRLSDQTVTNLVPLPVRTIASAPFDESTPEEVLAQLAGLPVSRGRKKLVQEEQ